MPDATSHRISGIGVHRTGLCCTSFHRFQAAAIFYPNFYPNRQRSEVEISYLLVTGDNWRGLPEFVTSLPCWSCGFDSCRPLQLTGFSRFTVRLDPDATSDFDGRRFSLSLVLRRAESRVGRG